MTAEEARNAIRINEENKTLEITKRLSDAASKIGTPAFEELYKVKAMFPGYEVKVVKKNNGTSRRKIVDKNGGININNYLRKITYADMRAYIEEKHSEDINLFNDMTAKMEKYVNGKKQMVSVNSYMKVKNWFIEKYGREMKEKLEKVSKAAVIDEKPEKIVCGNDSDIVDEIEAA